MNIINKIKERFKKKDKKEQAITNIQIEDVILPSFNELNEEEQIKVKQLSQKITKESLEEFLFYGEESLEKGRIILEQLLNIFYNLIEEEKKKTGYEVAETVVDLFNQFCGENNNKKNEEFIKLCFNNKINLERLYFYSKDLDDLKKDLIYHIIALEEKRKKRNPYFLEIFGVFKTSKLLDRKNTYELLLSTIERLKLNIKILEHNKFIIEKVYIENKQLELMNSINKSFYQIEDYTKLIEQKINNLTKFMNIYFDYQVSFDCKTEEEFISLFAKIHNEISYYILNNKEKIELFRKELDYLEQNYLSLKKEDILKKLEEIELFYKYSNVSFNEYKRFYEFKFKLLTSNFLNELILMDNPNTISPFQNIEDKHILKYYKDIITSILENVLKGNENTLISLIKNPRIKKEYVEYIQNTLKNKDNVYDYEEILKDKEKLAILLILNQTNIENYFSFHHFLRNSIWLNWKDSKGMINSNVNINNNDLYERFPASSYLDRQSSLEQVFQKLRIYHFYEFESYTFKETCYLMKEILDYFNLNELLYGKDAVYFEKKQLTKEDESIKLKEFFAHTFFIFQKEVFQKELEKFGIIRLDDQFIYKIDKNFFSHFVYSQNDYRDSLSEKFYFNVRNEFSNYLSIPISKYNFRALDNEKFRTIDFKPEGKEFEKWKENMGQKSYVKTMSLGFMKIN